MNINYQNYLHYKLPITMNPNDFGNVIEVINNKYIVQLHTNNVAIIKPLVDENFVRIFRKGELMFEFKDKKIFENTFIRTILDTKFTFKDGKLIFTEIISVNLSALIYSDTNSIKLTPLDFKTKNIFNYIDNSKNLNLFMLLFILSDFYSIDISNFDIQNSIIGLGLVGLSDLKDKIWKSIENSYIYNHKFAELFICFKLSLILLLFF